MNSKYREFHLNFITSKKKPFSSIMMKIYQEELVVRDCLLCKNLLMRFSNQQGHVISLKPMDMYIHVAQMLYLVC